MKRERGKENEKKETTGAGPSGLVSAKYLLESEWNFNVSIVDQGDSIGLLYLRVCLQWNLQCIYGAEHVWYVEVVCRRHVCEQNLRQHNIGIKQVYYSLRWPPMWTPRSWAHGNLQVSDVSYNMNNESCRCLRHAVTYVSLSRFDALTHSLSYILITPTRTYTYTFTHHTTQLHTNDFGTRRFLKRDTKPTYVGPF